MPKNVDASLIILIHKGKFLLVLRDDKPEIISPNSWCFVGGTKEPDETFEQTCKREVEEEIGVKLDSFKFLKSMQYLDRRKYFYYSRLSDEQVKNITLNEGQKYDFFTIDEIKTLTLARSTKMFVDQSEELLKSLTL